MKVIDCHMHFRPQRESFSDTAKLSGHENTEEHLREFFMKNEICHGVVMGNLGLEPENHNYPDFLSYCIGLDSNVFNTKSMEEFAYLAEENLKRDNCVGIKLYPGYCHSYIYDDMYEPFYELAKKYEKPVAIHTGALASSKNGGLLKYSHPLTLDEAAVKHPDVTFVMCHFGNPWLCDAAAVAEKNKNIIVDISGILEGQFDVKSFLEESRDYTNMLKMWLSYIGDYSRIMYGTDWPIVNMKSYLEFIKSIIPEEHHEKVFYENAKRVYKLKV